MQQYQKLCASAKIEFDGKVCNLSQLGPYQQSPDRAVRKAAAQAYGKFFDDHQQELDELFDKLVKNRTEQAHTLGLSNYVEMAYLLQTRNCYGPKEVANFRRQVVEEIVPVNNEIKARQAKRIGVEGMQVYDNTYFFPDGNPLPHGTPDELMQAGKQMYTEMSPETAEFIRVMFDHDLFDVLSKEGKAMGGYCTSLPLYHVPFIFANWNGTAGDVDVLTHEAGHAFADFMADKCIPHLDLRDPTMEVCESHSMSMEFLTAPWHHLFFREDTDKYELFHAESAMTFIPYGCQVDHFQESVYLHPEWTPAERNDEWNRLEKLYRPHLDNREVNFYNRGAGWQRQLAHLRVPVLLHRLQPGADDLAAVLGALDARPQGRLGQVSGLCQAGRHQDLCGYRQILRAAVPAGERRTDLHRGGCARVAAGPPAVRGTRRILYGKIGANLLR